MEMNHIHENFSLKVVWIDMSASVIDTQARFNDIIRQIIIIEL